MALQRTTRKPDVPRWSTEISCRGFETNHREPRQALPRTSRFRIHDEDDESEARGRACALRLNRAD